MGLEGKVAIVTGAWGMQTIGRANALRLARDGADVIVSDIIRPPDLLGEGEKEAGWEGIHSVAREVEALGRRSKAIVCDLTDPAQIENLIGETVSSMGRLDILVNGARAFQDPPRLGLLELTWSGWDHVYAVTTRGPMITTRLAADQMIKQGGGGTIINMTTMGAKKALLVGIAYASAMAAVNHMTRLAALELAPHGIRVNAVAPGVVATNRFSTEDVRKAKEQGITTPEYRRQWLDQRARDIIPLERVATADDVANVVSFLASEDGSYMVGQIVNVDGGVVMD
jgi:3-oxoacyl-[acyl-carrier protein] reductase/meso-butanediol dehydrogenase/(S,S)-butanediol dehydrogenase/diacetyl reductase